MFYFASNQTEINESSTSASNKLPLVVMSLTLYALDAYTYLCILKLAQRK